MIRRSIIVGFVLLSGCGDDSPSQTPPDAPSATPLDPDKAPVVAVDRFSDAFAHLFARSSNPALPAPNAPIDFDSGAPFITHGLSPDGNTIAYYNFDVPAGVGDMAEKPAPIFVLFTPGATAPVPNQLNIVDVIPGDPGYNDFWQVVKVTVPADYVANTITSFDELAEAGYPREMTPNLVNCPVVPDGSTARLRYKPNQPATLMRGWYKNKVVKYFSFEEKMLATVGSGNVPVSDIFVTFRINPNPNDPASGPASGFLTEAGTMQTHNVPMTMPEDAAYSPLWSVNVYDNQDFASVSNLITARAASLLAGGVALVNCPIVSETPSAAGGSSGSN